MKKRLLIILSCSACYIVGHSQESTIRVDTTINEHKDSKEIILNKFMNNWFIQGGAGVQHYFGDHNRQAKITEIMSPYFGLHVGKWFSPLVAGRIGVNGYQIKGLTQNGSHSTGEIYDASQSLSHQEFKYWHANADALLNLTNLFSGYNRNRNYNISSYLGLGWMVTEEPKQREVSANLGFYQSLNLSGGLDLFLDIRGAMVNDRFDGEIGGRRNEGQVAALLGLTYRFKKRDWDKPKETIISYDEQELKNLIARVNQFAKDNEALTKQLAEAKGKTITDIVVEKKVLAAPILVTFEINKSILSNEARVNLGFFAKVIKQGNPDIVYRVTGYADAGTGTAEINERLSTERANAVYKCLVNEFHVSPKQLKVDHKGGVENMYYNDPKLSRAVISIADN